MALQVIHIQRLLKEKLSTEYFFAANRTLYPFMYWPSLFLPWLQNPVEYKQCLWSLLTMAVLTEFIATAIVCMDVG